ncbi:MAG: apolipoprotein N-acyltransferase [Bdellovibrionales bacterium]|nr:apolipoprotein N-acyltransferase [Bdellovibrionales bacterium]
MNWIFVLSKRPSRAALWTILGTLSYVLSFPRFDLYQLMPLALFGWIFAVERTKSWRHALGLGLLGSFLIGLGGFHWVIYVARNFGGMPLPVAVILLLIFCLVAAPQLLAFFLIGHGVQPLVARRLPAWLAPFFWTFLYVGLEFLGSRIKLFPEFMGSPWIQWTAVAQVAAVGGASLLSFLPALMGAAGWALVRHRAWALPALSATLGLLTLAWVWGDRELRRWEDASPDRILRVAVIQANIGDVEKISAEMGSRRALDLVINRYLTLSQEAAAHGVDLIVWPETAYPLLFPVSAGKVSSSFASGYANLLESTIASTGTAHLIGTYEGVGETTYNAAALLSRDGKVIQTYRKVNLLMFGEKMPLSGWFPFLKKLNPNLGDFGQGEGPFPLSLRLQPDESTVKIGVNICYEAVMPAFMREMAIQGSHLFLNLTNDSWFGPTFEPWQHLQLAALRSIENRIPTVRATNTGISALISPVGRIENPSPLFEARVAPFSVALRPAKSFYRRHGDWFACAALLLGFVPASVGLAFRRWKGSV